MMIVRRNHRRAGANGFLAAGAMLILWIGAHDSMSAAPETQNTELGTAAEQAALRDTLQAVPYALLYECYTGDNWELMRCQPDGSQPINITQTPQIHELYPQASPQGDWICFLADVESQGVTQRSVYRMRVDGSDRTLVADQARDPCWNHDGTRIAFVPQEFAKFNVTDYVSKGLSIYDMATSSSTPAPCSDKIEHLYNLSWSPDDRWIVATVHGGMGFGHAILAIDWRTGTIVDLQVSGCRPCLSVDGQWMAWSENDHRVCVARIDWSGSQPRVTDKQTVDEREGLHLYHPDISPDGKFVSYSVGPGGRVPRSGPGTHAQLSEMIGVRGQWNIHVRRADGSGPSILVTTDPTQSNKESDWLPVVSR